MLERGVRQGCVIGPTFFNLVFDEVCKKCVKRVSEIGHLAYADDLVIMSDTIEEAQESLDALSQEVKNAGIEISLSKTEIVVVNGEGSNDIYLNGEKVKEVNSFVYLGSSLNAEADLGEAIANNCRKARTAIVRLRPALVSGSIRMRTKVRLVETFFKANTTVFKQQSSKMSTLTN